MSGTSLRPWQQENVDSLSDHRNDRDVIWGEDCVGNTGKISIASYLRSEKGSIAFTNTSERDIAYAYNGQSTVCFDFSRGMGANLELTVVEHIKNSYVFSSNHQSEVKEFDPLCVLCLANCLPCRRKLSTDRWVVYSIIDGKLSRLLCFNSLDKCTENHFCNNK